MTPPSVLLLAALAAAGQGQVVVDVVVEDSRGALIKDISKSEVMVHQDDVRQTVLSFHFSEKRGCYELRYVPPSGRVGAVSIQVARGGSRLRGPGGSQVKPRWVAPVPEFERPLRAALEAPQAADALAYHTAILRFEARDDTLHHAFLAEIPFASISFQGSGGIQRAHLAFLLRVVTEDGRTVHEGSLDQPLEVGGDDEPGVDVRRFIWSTHVHLHPGRYRSELVVMDRQGSKLGVRRTPLVVEPWVPGLRVGSLTFLLGLGGLMKGDETDNPLRLDDQALLPMLRPAWVAGTDGQLSLLAMVYPDGRSKEPVTAAIELHRDGQLRARAAVPLPAAGPDGDIRYVGGLKFASLQAGSYVVKLVAQQGAARAEESAVLEVSSPLRLP